jgi:membrane-associated protease RseP (regulator of RpoE activity)
MNLIPIGQLDGGHISFAMFGNRYHVIGQTALVILMILGLTALLPLVGVDFQFGWVGWLLWGVIIMVLIRVMKLGRPPVTDETPLDPVRRAIGWLCFAILITSFSPAPFTVSSADVLF